MIRSQIKMINDLENCYNCLARSLIKNASLLYNTSMPLSKEDVLNYTAIILAESLDPLMEGNDATISIEEVVNNLMRMEKAKVSNTDDIDCIRHKIHGVLKNEFAKSESLIY